MRILTCVVALCVFAGTARADYSKAWTAAKDNLPATTRVVATIDVAAIVKSAHFAPLFATARKVERDLDEAYTQLQKTCKLDPLAVVEGLVIAGDPEKNLLAIYMQLSIDRAKASGCLEAMLKVLANNKPSSVRQDGIYTLGTVKRETAYFAWVAPNVVVFNVDIDNKQKLDAWIGHKTFGKSAVAPLMAKTDPKATAAIAYALAKPLDRKIPVSSGYGYMVLGGGNVQGMLLGITPDAAGASMGAAEMNRELQRERDRPRNAPALRTALHKIVIAARGNEITIQGAGTEKDLADALATELKPKKPPVEATPPTPSP